MERLSSFLGTRRADNSKVQFQEGEEVEVNSKNLGKWKVGRIKKDRRIHSHF